MIREVPCIDFRKAISNKKELLSDLKHALLEFGVFHLSHYDEVLDQNVIELLLEETRAFYRLSQASKEEMSMKNCKNFTGYVNEKRNNLILKEEFIINSVNASSSPKSDQNDEYHNLLEPSQLLSEECSPLLNSVTDTVLPSLSKFSLLLTELIFQSLDVRSIESKPYINLQTPAKQFSQLKLVNYPNSSQYKSEVLPHRHSEFLTYWFNPSLQFQDIYDDWQKLEAKKNTILVAAGQALEYLTQGVCVSDTYRVDLTRAQRCTFAEFHQNINLDAHLRPFTILSGLLDERDKRDSVRERMNVSPFTPNMNRPFGSYMLRSLVKQYRDISLLNYPSLLRTIEKLENDNDEYQKVSTTELGIKLEKLERIFNALERTIMLKMNRTSDIKLKELVPDTKNMSRLNVTITNLLQIAYIWPKFSKLIIDKDGDIAIDIDEAKASIKAQNLSHREVLFKEKTRTWLKMNQESCYDIPVLETSDLEPNNDESPRKRIKISNHLKNSHEQFLLEPKIEQQGQSGKGLQLLDRIRLKEKIRKESCLTPQQKYQTFIEGKLTQALNIIFTLRDNHAYLLCKLAEKMANSLTTTPVSEQEAHDIILHLTKLFPTELKVVQTKDGHVVRWKELSRSTMFNYLKSTTNKTNN